MLRSQMACFHLSQVMDCCSSSQEYPLSCVSHFREREREREKEQHNNNTETQEESGAEVDSVSLFVGFLSLWFLSFNLIHPQPLSLFE